jgi:uncharacterized protein (TIGR02996 family)
MAWRIEQAKSDRSTCRVCGMQIAKGEHRFGNDDLNATWYHLACGAEGKPRAFKPFAARAAKLMPKTAKPAAKPKAAKPGKRDRDLEARLIENPDDADARAVFADLLQSQGDPWGEIIALASAGKTKEAKKLQKQHAEALTGGFGPRLFEWRRGFIHSVKLDRIKPAQLAPMLEGIFAQRTAFLVRDLVLPIALDAAGARDVSRLAPPTIRSMFTWASDGLAHLALPSLEHLTLHVVRDVTLDANALAPFFQASRLPKLRRFEVWDRPFPAPVFDAFLASKLLRQLDWLELNEGSLDRAQAQLVLAKPEVLAHVSKLSMFESTCAEKLVKRFRSQVDAWSEASDAEQEAKDAEAE